MSIQTDFPLDITLRRLGDGVVLAEALLYPEAARLGGSPAEAAAALRRDLGRLLRELPRTELGRRRMVPEAGRRSVVVELAPPRHSAAWRDPVRLRFPAAWWRHGEAGAWLARLPDLAIEAVAATEAELDDVLPKDAIATLRRVGLAASLEGLTWVQRVAAFGVVRANLRIDLPTMKESARRAEERAEADRPKVLRQVATDLNALPAEPAYELDDAVAQLADALTAKPAQSVLLVGPSGVGKTAAVRELVRNRESFHLGATPFYATSGSRLVAGMSGFGMWQERCRDLVREAAKLRAVLHLGNLVELMEVGRSTHNKVGIASFLRPLIARGELLCVAECTPEQIPFVEKDDPQLFEAFRRITLDEPDAGRGRRILEGVARHRAAGGAQVVGPGGSRHARPAAPAVRDLLGLPRPADPLPAEPDARHLGRPLRR